MATAKTCRDEEKAVDRAKAKRPNWLVHPIEARRFEKSTVNPLQERLKDCEKRNSQARAILMARGMARAAYDCKVKFPMKRDWHQRAGLGKKDNEIERQLKVRNVEDAVVYIHKFAKKNSMAGVAGQATVVESLKDVLTDVDNGAITLQAILGVLDVVATIVSLGSYAAVAPAVHAAVESGRQVTAAIVQRDLDAAERTYQERLKDRATRLKEAEREKRERLKEAEREKQERLSQRSTTGRTAVSRTAVSKPATEAGTSFLSSLPAPLRDPRVLAGAGVGAALLLVLALRR
jgi:hypothetical protein